MRFHSGMGLEPMLVLLVRVKNVEDDVKLVVRKSRGDAVHEVEKLDAATAVGIRMVRGSLRRDKRRTVGGGDPGQKSAKEFVD